MFILYNLFYLLFIPLIIIRDILTIDKNQLKTVAQRLGFKLGKSREDTIWLHGVSLGESKIVIPLAKKIAEQGIKVLVSSTTNTGRKEIENKLSNTSIETIPFPYDLGSIHKKIINQYQVKKIILFESEFWPNLINSSDDVKVISINTSVSDQSFKRYKFFKNFSKHIFSRVNLFLAQTEETVDRLKELGAGDIKLLGNIKNNPENYSVDGELAESFATLIDDNAVKVVLGSSHEGEEEFFYEALKDLQGLKLIIAPRHPERINGIIETFEKRSVNCVKFSNLLEGENSNTNDIVIFDLTGELLNFYSVCDIAVVAGSIIFDRGHNFMEPTYADTLSITGSKLENYKELKKRLCDSGVYETFSDSVELKNLVLKYLDQNARELKVKSQKIELEKISSTYDEVIAAINEL